MVHDIRSLILPGKAGKLLTVGIEDVGKTIPEESFAHAIKQAIDSSDEPLKDVAQETSHKVKETVEDGPKRHTEMYAADENNDSDLYEIVQVTAPGNVNECVNRSD